MRKTTCRTNVLTTLLFSLFLSLFLLAAGPSEVSADAREDSCADARWLLDTYYEPEYFLDTGMYNIQNGYGSRKYTDLDQYEAICSTTDELVGGLSSDEEKCRAIHDWICRNITYPADQEDYNGYPEHKFANPLAVFKNRSGVCYGFANLTQLMCQRAGIPCVIVRGYAHGSHVWNAVYVGGQWRFTDNTFDQGLSKEDQLCYDQFLMDDETYSGTYYTSFMENWAGDVCYNPTYVSPGAAYHTIHIDTDGGTLCCPDRLPYCEKQDKIVLPVPDGGRRSFYTYSTTPDIGAGYNFAFGFLYQDAAAKGVTQDIYLKAKYTKAFPQEGLDYTLPEGLTAREGQTLSEVALPHGFSWNKPETKLTKPGEGLEFAARFTPDDTDYFYTCSVTITVTVLADHTWKETVTTEPTCTRDGEMLRTCTICGVSETVTLPAGHSYGEWTVIRKGSCTGSTLREKTCSACGDVVSEEIPAPGHDLIHYEAAEGDCETPGHEAYDRCAVCGFETPHSETPAAGHSWEQVKNAAGLLKNGSEYEQCTVCGAKRGEKVLKGWSTSYVKGLKVEKGKKSLTVRWTKQSASVRKKFGGYQIRYSLKANMKNAKTVTASNTAASKKISRLKSGKKYYIQVRTFTKKGGVKYYSEWSARKSVTVK